MIGVCDIFNGGCEQVCTAEGSSVTCSCNDGFALYNQNFCTGKLLNY